MTYHVYENWQAEGHKARIHFSDCSFCNYGRGIHPNASEKHGCWRGSFPTYQEADSVAHGTGGDVRDCKKCNPK